LIEAERGAILPAHTPMRIGTLAHQQQSALFIIIIHNFAQSLVCEWA
jgi:hypothetical protein